MTFFSSRARSSTPAARRDRSVALILVVLLVLVFAPVVGLHIVLTTLESPVVADPRPPDGLAAALAPSKRSRG
jgi:cell division septal protein FtsQ